MNVNSLFKKGVNYTLRDGESILFWEDLWLRERLLRDVCRPLYNISALKKAIFKECRVSSISSIFRSLGIVGFIDD